MTSSEIIKEIGDRLLDPKDDISSEEWAEYEGHLIRVSLDEQDELTRRFQALERKKLEIIKANIASGEKKNVTAAEIEANVTQEYFDHSHQENVCRQIRDYIILARKEKWERNHY